MIYTSAQWKVSYCHTCMDRQYIRWHPREDGAPSPGHIGKWTEDRSATCELCGHTYESYNEEMKCKKVY